MQGLLKIKMHVFTLSLCGLLLAACDSKKQPAYDTQAEDVVKQLEKADVLPFLNLEQVKAQYALPLCQKNNCIEIDIQSIHTQDTWLNQWLSDSQALVIQDQIGLQQVMSLQHAIDAYVKKSDTWQAEFIKNEAYTLHVQTRIAAQRNQYVLLQLIVNSKQATVTVKDRGYFLVADRKAQKKLTLLDVIDPQQHNAMNRTVQDQYQDWLAQQSKAVQTSAPEKLDWGQNDWFFDGEGIGLHYRANQIAQEGTQLDLYLNKQQTQQVLKPEIFKQLF